MNIAQIESNISKLTKKISPESFIYDLLLAYGLPKASITRLQKGNLNLSKRPGEISWKKKVLFREEHKADLHVTVTEMLNDAKNDQRFVIATDYKMLLAIDTKTGDKLDTTIKDLPKTFDFFLPWAGMEKAQYQGENPADVKAAEKMAKLFDEIKRDNPSDSAEDVHNLNVFLSRLLFCYFAEDTNIFRQGQFINAISSHTQQDGSDLGQYLEKLFIVLNTEVRKRKRLPDYLSAFPYVNGGLFSQDLPAPKFTRRSRQAVIDCGDLDWSAINLDIFGSMMQAVVTPENRGELGMHYTSVPNIMKVIEPLFLNALYEKFHNAKGNQKKLNALLEHIATIKIFDPACGSGNFLIIAYKELRKLEMEIFKTVNMMPMSGVSLSQFYGIELDDFAHEIAQLSLWLAEHQMNTIFYNEFGKSIPTLPLKQAGNIIQGNACLLDWNNVCPKQKDEYVYVLGNPPYVGARIQSSAQKNEVRNVYNSSPLHKDADYISCWFLKAAKYIQNSCSSFAFVSTNSICQGDHVAILWPMIIEIGLEIFFAHTSFKWTNSAKSNAGVTCIIVGVRNLTSARKYIFTNGLTVEAKNINAYLVDAANVYVSKSKNPISERPKAVMGSQARDGGHLILSDKEREDLLSEYPGCERIIRRLIGSEEYIHDTTRWCLWIEDQDKEFAESLPSVKRRINNVYSFRISSKAKTTNGYAKIPHQFAQRAHKNTGAIIIPAVSSEKRPYIPFGILDNKQIVSNRAFVIYEQNPYIFALISSHMHMCWIRAVAGRLETRINYSSGICYNTFPFPDSTSYLKSEVERAAFKILAEREKYPDKTLAQIYDPDSMPTGLLRAHAENDAVVERAYRSTPFRTDEERLQYLFQLYEKVLQKSATFGTLFAIESEKKRRKK